MARKTPRKGRGKGGRGPSRKTIPAQRRLADKAARKPTRGRKSAPKAVAQKIVAHRKTSVFARAPLKFKTRKQYEDDLILNSKVKVKASKPRIERIRHVWLDGTSRRGLP